MDIEKWLKEAFKDYKPKRQGACLTEDDIACVLERKLDDQQRELLVRHINSCASCAGLLKEHLFLSRASESKPLMKAPKHLVERAKAIVPGEQRPDIFEIIVNFTQDAIMVLRTTGDILSSVPAAAPALRTGKRMDAYPEVTIGKTYKDLAIEVGIQKKGPDAVDIIVKVAEKKTPKGSEDFRVNLFRGDRELRSIMTEKGKVKFEALKIDNYRLVITKEGKCFAIIQLQAHSNS